MSLFQCEKCGCLENTALCGYWFRKGKALCSKCDPNIGKWHGAFKRRKPTKKEMKMINFIDKRSK